MMHLPFDKEVGACAAARKSDLLTGQHALKTGKGDWSSALEGTFAERVNDQILPISGSASFLSMPFQAFWAVVGR
jgi:hypothetical protein